MANPHRGEVAVKLARLDDQEGLEELVLRPTFSAIIEIEDRLGTGLSELLERFRMAPPKYGVRDVTAIVTAGLHGAGQTMSYDLVGRRIMETGMDRVALPALSFLVSCWLGGQDPQTAVATTEPASPSPPPATPSPNGSDSPAPS